MTAVFSSGNMENRRQWNNIFKVLKEKNCQVRILYLVKIYFKNEGKIKKYSAKGKLRVVASRTGLKEMLTKVLQANGRWYHRETWNLINEERATEVVNIWVNTADFFLKIFKIWLLKAKIITLLGRFQCLHIKYK